MADKAITDLTQAQQITDEDLFVLEQSGEAKKLPGSKLVKYAKDAVEEEVQGVKEYADDAKASADAAAASATKAASAAQGIDDKVAAADASAKAAAAAAIEAAESATGVDEKVQAAQTAADNAAKSETAAKNAQTDAANAQKAAETAQTGAQDAKTAAESAQEAAESAKDAAAGSATAAGQKATQAVQSAEDAASAKSAAETAKTDAQAARDAIVNMIVEAVTLETGKPATVSKSLVDNVYKLVFGLPRGETGATGLQGATGNGISGIALKSGNHAPGTSDIYTITLTDGTTYDFAVYNGANGAGAGDMLASVYDPQGKHQDIFKYVDNAIKDVKVTTDATPTQGSTNPVQSGGVYSALVNKLDKTGDGSNVTAAFTAASSRDNIATGEKLSVLLGKIAKWLGDLKALAFKDKVAKTDLESAVQDLLLPDGGTTGQVVTKTADGQEWADAAGGVFWATKDVTTYDQIIAAVQANKLVLAQTNTDVYQATSVDSESGIIRLTSLGNLSPLRDVDNLYKGVLMKCYMVLISTTKWVEANVWIATAEMAKPQTRKVTLTVAGWNSSTKQQTVACTGILADATKQEIFPNPVDTSYDNAWDTCGIKCVAQAANSLTFQCSEIPTSAIEVYVTVITLSYKG